MGIEIPVAPRIPVLVQGQNGIIATLSGGVLTISFSGVQTAQVYRAARPILTAINGSVSAFLASVGGPDTADGSWEVANVAPFAPVGGALSVLMQNYLVTVLGQSTVQANTTINAIWTAAAGLTV